MSQPRQASATRSLEDELEEALHHPFTVLNDENNNNNNSSSIIDDSTGDATTATTSTTADTSSSNINNVNNTNSYHFDPRVAASVSAQNANHHEGLYSDAEGDDEEEEEEEYSDYHYGDDDEEEESDETADDLSSTDTNEPVYGNHDINATASANRDKSKPLVRNGWDAIASVGECVSDLEKEMSALLSHHRKQCQVSRRSVSECDDRIKWLTELQQAVDAEKRQAVFLRDLLSRDSIRHNETEQRVREVASSQKTLSDKDFFPLELEEVRADARLKKLDDDAKELKEVMNTLTEREKKSKTRQTELDDRERKARQSLDDLDRKTRMRRHQELRLEERERTASRHESAIETWSKTLDIRESECQQRRSHLDRCFKALERAEASLGLTSSTAQNTMYNNGTNSNTNSPGGVGAAKKGNNNNLPQNNSPHRAGGYQQQGENDENAYGGFQNSHNTSTASHHPVSKPPTSSLAFEPEDIALNDDEDEV